MNVFSTGACATDPETRGKHGGSQNSDKCHSQRTLIVDDDAAILRLFRIFLTSAIPDMSVDLAQNGDEAIKAFADAHHGLVLIDLNMPVMDGQKTFSAMQELCRRRHWKMPSVVFCSGTSLPQGLEDVVEEDPSNAWLLKPVTYESVVGTVKRMLG